MHSEVTFLGPINVYARREDGEWVAWADPFSMAGTGRTFDEAMDDLRKNLEVLFTALAEGIRKHGSKVEAFTPLDDELKRAEKTASLFLCAMRSVSRKPRPPSPVRSLSRRSLFDALRSNSTVGVAPAACPV